MKREGRGGVTDHKSTSSTPGPQSLGASAEGGEGVSLDHSWTTSELSRSQHPTLGSGRVRTSSWPRS